MTHAGTWREVVLDVLRELDPKREGVPLPLVYDALEGHPRTKTNPTWMATVRRTLQELRPTTEQVSRGIWRIAQAENDSSA